jgi:hypothetical protein
LLKTYYEKKFAKVIEDNVKLTLYKKNQLKLLVKLFLHENFKKYKLINL